MDDGEVGVLLLDIALGVSVSPVESPSMSSDTLWD